MINRIITIIMAVFLVAGALDRIFLKNRLGLGKELENGIAATGPLILSMAGLMCASPLIGKALSFVFTPVFNLIGADPAVSAGMFLAIDMGGYSAACSMTEDTEIRLLSGELLASTLGTIIVFYIPVGLGMCKKEIHPLLCRGIAAAIIASPICAVVGGLIAGIDFVKIIVNLIPALVICALMTVLLLLVPEGTVKGLMIFARVIEALATVFLATAAVTMMTGFTIIPGMEPLGGQIETVAEIGIVLMGAYPMVYVLKAVLKPAFTKLAAPMKLDSQSLCGMLASLANPIPYFQMTDGMCERGVIVSMAFCCGCGATFGDHLGFMAAACPDYIYAVIPGKLVCGIAAAVIAYFMVPKHKMQGNSCN